jgi:hypothetical protein
MGVTRAREALVVSAVLLAACAPAKSPERTVSFRLAGSPPDAMVTIDDIVVGSLAVVAARGVALPVGAHRLSVEAAGYFPADRIIDARDVPVRVRVDLERTPD